MILTAEYNLVVTQWKVAMVTVGRADVERVRPGKAPAPGDGAQAAKRQGADSRQTTWQLKTPKHMLPMFIRLHLQNRDLKKKYLEFQGGNCIALNTK